MPKTWHRAIQLFVRPETSLKPAEDHRLRSNLEHGKAMTMSKEKTDA
jgi:hypothetical protein